MKEAFKQEIDNILKVGALKPVHEATHCINSFILVEGKDKFGNLKFGICLDPTNINKAILHEPYYFKTPEDIAHLLVEACVMTVCDWKKGYWHQQLDETPPLLTTFNTELERFCCIVMPFGATVAADVFQCKLDQCFGKIRQVIVIADDIIIVVYKQNHSDHDQALTALLETARRCNVKLNYEKLHYKKDEADNFGETYTTSSCKPDKNKISVINAMPLPTNKKHVQSFICMINYLSKFSHRLSEIVEPIRELAMEKVHFNWGPENQSALIQMKKKCKCPSSSILQSQETSSVTNRCQHKRSWCLSNPR